MSKKCWDYLVVSATPSSSMAYVKKYLLSALRKIEKVHRTCFFKITPMIIIFLDTWKKEMRSFTSQLNFTNVASRWNLKKRWDKHFWIFLNYASCWNLENKSRQDKHLIKNFVELRQARWSGAGRKGFFFLLRGSLLLPTPVSLPQPKWNPWSQCDMI